uniref:UDP glucuronosyltransferase family 2 member A2 n=1 Tax=Athene cunicularia TaxID=194338 RepID=A0A663MUT3_ATHCN
MATRPTGSKKYLQLLLFQVTFLGPVFCGNVLVWPSEGSHWLNMKIIIQELIHRGHSVTILVSSASLFIKPGAESMEKFEVYNVPFKKDTIENLIEDVVALWLNNRPTILTFWQFYKNLGKLSKNWHHMNRLMCDAVLTNQELMAHLQGSRYDLLLSDPVTLCGDVLALKLVVPFIYSLRFSPASTVERHCGKIPAPPSYTPAALSELTDCMSFGQRIKNIVSYHLQDYIFQSYWGEWDIYYSKVLGKCSAASLLTTQPPRLTTCRARNLAGSQSQGLREVSKMFDIMSLCGKGNEPPGSISCTHSLSVCCAAMTLH